MLVPGSGGRNGSLAYPEVLAVRPMRSRATLARCRELWNYKEAGGELIVKYSRG